MVIIAIPLLVLLMLSIRNHYRTVDHGLALARIPPGAGTAPEPIARILRGRSSSS
jgi:hypothetical protein